MPARTAPPTPSRWDSVSQRTPRPGSSASVSSVDPSFTTRMSSGGITRERSLTTRRRLTPSLKAGTIASRSPRFGRSAAWPSSTGACSLCIECAGAPRCPSTRRTVQSPIAYAQARSRTRCAIAKPSAAASPVRRHAAIPAMCARPRARGSRRRRRGDLPGGADDEEHCGCQERGDSREHQRAVHHHHGSRHVVSVDSSAGGAPRRRSGRSRRRTAAAGSREALTPAVHADRVAAEREPVAAAVRR